VNLRSPARFLGRLTLLLAGAELVPAICSMFYGEWEVVITFLIASAVTAILGGLLVALGRNGGEIYRREGILIVVGGWVFASIFGALPYLFAGTFPNPVDALFESASGFTTTGASVMTVIEAHSRGILFWRCFTQWLGGMGIIVLFVALLPELGPGARFLYKLEVPGPTAEALVPRIHHTAAVLWKIYLMISGLEVVLLMLAGMNLYDALTHTFSTMSTGGFSPYNSSIAAFDSPAIHIIIIVFMVLAGTNFSLFFGMRRLKGWRYVWRDTEFRLYLAILGGTSLILIASLMRAGAYDRPGRALLDATFQAVSITTTNGFATADFDGWPALAQMLLVGLMFVGGCAGSARVESEPPAEAAAAGEPGVWSVVRVPS
jgi:trk system potassium uptake protein TrkH